MTRSPLLLCLLLLAAAPGWAQSTSTREDAPEGSSAPAPADGAAQVDAPAEDAVARQLEVLAEEIERLKLGEVAPSASEGLYGLGPAASKVYRQHQGVSLGGYGEVLYQNGLESKADARLDFQRNVLYVGYKFDDHFVLNTELEVEHASELFLEFAYLDYLWRPEANLRAGLLLVPMGFVNELHEPTTFLGALRPQTEQRLLPSTWREMGVGLFGDVGALSYRAYAVTGLNAAGFTSAGLQGGRQRGVRAMVDDVAVVVRADWRGLPGLQVGGSLYYGGADHDQYDFAVNGLIYEAHADFRWRGLQLRGLYAGARVDGAGELGATLGLAPDAGVASGQRGWYVQGGYDVLSLVPDSRMSLLPYVRLEHIDTQAAMPTGFTADPTQQQQLLTVGAQLYPLNQLVVKAELSRITDARLTTQTRANVLLGYIF